jgi:hypothetical protein
MRKSSNPWQAACSVNYDFECQQASILLISVEEGEERWPISARSELLISIHRPLGIALFVFA